MRVLVIANDGRLRQQLVKALSGAGFEVNFASRCTIARAALTGAAQKFAVVVVEESIAGGKGLQLAREIRSQRRDYRW